MRLGPTNGQQAGGRPAKNGDPATIWRNMAADSLVAVFAMVMNDTDKKMWSNDMKFALIAEKLNGMRNKVEDIEIDDRPYEKTFCLEQCNVANGCQPAKQLQGGLWQCAARMHTPLGRRHQQPCC